MYVCMCKGITDKDIQQQVSEGAARLKDVVKNLDLGKDCAQCVVAAREVFQEAVANVVEDLFYDAGLRKAVA